ncbi:hypothetical protein L596_007129 [Steinernema carpocapsae]|uniref:Uncharacterized protein n=1 Tax=Steinernema carpocapsae TaxID=34508 RepID=A0A4U5P921_STECR|nr:hypothetical protein L596_007129 [Steinernema carpocapsae]
MQSTPAAMKTAICVSPGANRFCFPRFSAQFSMGNGQSSRGASKDENAPTAIPRRRRRTTGCWILKMCSSKQRRSIREHKKPDDDTLKPSPPLPVAEEAISEPPEVRFRAETPPPPSSAPPRPPSSLSLKTLNNNFEKEFPPTPLSTTNSLACTDNPSIAASSLIGNWKNKSPVLRPSGDSAFGDSIASTCSVDTPELTTPSTCDHGGLSLHSYESLMQIIRCFPFPSPKNSPRSAKRLNRTMSDEETNDRGPPPPHSPSGISFHQSMVGNSRSGYNWNGAKRQIGNSIANVLKQIQ